MARPSHLFDFELPRTLIAQEPLPRREEARLMAVRRGQEGSAHHSFSDLPGLLPADALLVVNNTRVMPWRLLGRLPNGGPIEALLLEEPEPGLWVAMVKRARRVRPGMILRFAGHRLCAEAVRRTAEGYWVLRFPAGVPVAELLELYGLAPLPPYIHREGTAGAARDRESYQTCFARVDGAVAAPTAGLHFVPEVLDRIRERGVTIAEVTLHVGVGTFSPIKTEYPALHKMHAEWYEVPEEAAREILAFRAAGRPVVAVGTTTVRALESWAALGFPPRHQGQTEIFIRPPYDFRVVDGIITNFHQPRSTLLMLVAAFHGPQPLLDAYRAAVSARYRFYSFGDCMAILPRPA